MCLEIQLKFAVITGSVFLISHKKSNTLYLNAYTDKFYMKIKQMCGLVSSSIISAISPHVQATESLTKPMQIS